MSQAALHSHLQAVAQAGYQKVLFHTHQGMLKSRNEAYHVWDHVTEAFQQHAWGPIFVDEAHAGVILASTHDLQHQKDSLKAELKAASQETEKARHDTKEAWQTALIMDRQIANLKKELEDVEAARDHAIAD